MQMENEQPNQSISQLLIQHISEAAIYTDAHFTIIACNKAATTLFHYNARELTGSNISILAIAADGTNNPPPAIKNIDFNEAMATCINRWGQKLPVHITRHAINPAAGEGGYLFIYRSADEEQESPRITAQLRELSDHLLTIRETERTNIAREIHDELGQQLTILKMDVSWLYQKLQKYKDATLIEKTGDTLKMLNETIKTVRRIATELRPSMLDDLGLVEALEWQSKEFEKRSGIKIIFESAISHLPVSNAIATSLFRIYQEALTNVARHAQAKKVYCTLQVKHNQVILSIKDDGAGFDMKTLGIKKTLGLLGMKERALMMGGRFDIYSKPGEGTSILVTTTLPADNNSKSPPGQ